MSERVQAQLPGPTEQPQGCAGWLMHNGRLRSGWRVTLYLVAARLVDIVVGIAVGIVLVAMIVARQGQAAQTPAQIANAITSIVSNMFEYPALILGTQALRVVFVLVLVWLFRQFVDRRSFRSLGFDFTRGWWLEFVAGFALVVAGWGVIFALSLIVGATTITGLAWDRSNWIGVAQSLAVGLALNMMVGIVEEADARGYVLQNLAEGIGFWPAVFLSSVYFGLLHFLNPGASAASTVGIFFAGVLLALGYYATGRLWFPIGMHAAWNFAEGPIFGFLVSGLDMGGLFDTRVTGPDWLMGGAFGPEAGGLAVAIEVILILIVFSWSRGRRREPILT